MKKYKKTDDVSYTLGTTVTLELLINKVNIVQTVYINSKQIRNNTYQKIVNICNSNNIPIVYEDKIFNILSDKDNCYVIGIFKKYNSKINCDSNHVVLVNPSNMGNLGTIIRTQSGFDIKDLAIIEPAVDIFDPKVVRASMGAVFRINFTYYNSFDEYVASVDERTLYPFILNGKNNLSTVVISNRYSLIFGNEASGLPNEFNNIGKTIVIKHTNQIDSLNLDNAVSIALYEFTKNKFNK